MFNLANDKDRGVAIKLAEIGESAKIVAEVRKRCTDWENVPQEKRRFEDANEFLNQVIIESGGRKGEEKLEALLNTGLIGSIEDLMKDPENTKDR